MLDNKLLQLIRDVNLGVTSGQLGDLNSTIYLQQIRDAILGDTGIVPGSMHEIIYLQQIRNAILGVPDGQFGSMPVSVYLQEIINAANGVALNADGSLDDGVYLEQILELGELGAETLYSISGVVYDADGSTAVAGATVALGALTATSAANGTYTIADIPVGTSGSMTCVKTGYSWTAITISAMSGSLTAQNYISTDFVVFTTAVTPSVFDPSWTFSDASVMTVNWGDGSAPESHATGLNHTYANAGTKRVVFSCPDWTKLTIFNILNDSIVAPLPDFARAANLEQCVLYANSTLTGNVPSMPSNTKLQVFYAYQNAHTGTIPSFETAINLIHFRTYLNQLSGIIPSFAANTKLASFRVDYNLLTGYTAGTLATQKSLTTCSLNNNRLPVSAIDSILADLVTSLGISGRVACTVDLSSEASGGYFNEAPTDLDDVTTLQAAGWTVTVNSEPYIFLFGDSITLQLTPALHTSYKSGANLCVNLSVGGARIIDPGTGNSLAAQVDSPIVHDAAHIFVLIGTNDITTAEAITTEYQAQLEEIKTKNPSATVYGLGILDRATDMPNVVAKNARIATACTNASVTYVDTSGWITPATDCTDGLHLNATGIGKVNAQLIALLPA